jgi:putative nucleotidyltransferase-like protein
MSTLKPAAPTQKKTRPLGAREPSTLSVRALPPLMTIAAALRKTTEFLARELVAPTAHPPEWTDFEWRIARAATAMHGVSSLLCAGLRWAGPESWRQFLGEQRDHAVGRHLQIVRLLDAIDSEARARGIALVALKGAALYARGIYAAGERPMGDIDLLIPPNASEAMAQLLGSCGYTIEHIHRREQVFRPANSTIPPADRLGEHVDNPIRVEVHTRIAEPLPVLGTDITPSIFPRSAHAGVNEYPSAASLMMHLLLHAAGNMRARALRLIQLHDVALLAARFVRDDWEELLTARPDDRGPWWAFAPLMLTARYYPGVIPESVLAELRTHCPTLLRKHTHRQGLVGVSWSNILIEPFPGVEWSRTPGEALRFMRSRIWPSRDALRELNEGAAQIPDVSAVPWYGVSHGKRILRWIFTRPPRVQTLLIVRAALSQGH